MLNEDPIPRLVRLERVMRPAERRAAPPMALTIGGENANATFGTRGRTAKPRAAARGGNGPPVRIACASSSRRRCWPGRDLLGPPSQEVGAGDGDQAEGSDDREQDITRPRGWSRNGRSLRRLCRARPGCCGWL
jgi:hypothetical protein